MMTRIPRSWQRGLVAGLLALPATTAAFGQEPVETPETPAVAEAPKRTARDVEVYFGTRKVSAADSATAPMRATPVMIVPVSVKTWASQLPQSNDLAQQPAAIARTLYEPAREPLAITVHAYAFPAPAQDAALPNAPWLGANASGVTPAAAFASANSAYAPAASHTGGAGGQAAAQPTVVVIRDSAAEGRPYPAPAPESARGVTLGPEALLGLGLGLLGVGVGVFLMVRRGAPASVKYLPSSPAVAPDGGILLMGKYNAGPPREKPEKFDIGPNYQAEALEKKKTAKQNEQAVLEFILSQNLALQAELSGAAELPEAVEVVPEDVAAGALLAAVH